VPGTGVPAGVLACRNTTLTMSRPPHRASAELLRRARASRPETTVPLETGMPRNRMDEPLFTFGGGIPLPLFCGEDSAGYDGQVGSSRILVSIAPRRGEELRQLDAWPGRRAAEAAYDFLLESARGCPQHGETGLTTELHEGYLGSRTFEMVASDVGTGGGTSLSTWVVVQRGSYVLVVLAGNVDRSPRPAMIGTVVRELTELSR
jgi:hypothetical protein